MPFRDSFQGAGGRLEAIWRQSVHLQLPLINYTWSKESMIKNKHILILLFLEAIWYHFDTLTHSQTLGAVHK